MAMEIIDMGFRINYKLIEAIKEIKQERYYVSTRKVAPYLKTTQYPSGIKIIHKRFISLQHYLKQLKPQYNG